MSRLCACPPRREPQTVAGKVVAIAHGDTLEAPPALIQRILVSPTSALDCPRDANTEVYCAVLFRPEYVGAMGVEGFQPHFW